MKNSITDDIVIHQVYLKTNDSDFVSIGKTTNQQLTYLSTISANTKYSWYPDSYNAVNINKNKITFTDGKKNTTSILKRFELPSEIPVAEGYRSYAFSMKLKANETGISLIPLLSKNINVYALIISDSEAIE